MSYIQFYHLDQFIQGFDALFGIETDRGGAVVAACFIEGFIEDVLDLYVDTPLSLPALAKPFTDKKSFAYDIDLLRRKQLANDTQIANFHFIRELRNIFAHNLEAADFTNPLVAALLRDHLGMVEGSERKEAFIAVLRDCTGVLMNLSHEKFHAAKRAQFEQYSQELAAFRAANPYEPGGA